jgi:hypothetical protein
VGGNKRKKCYCRGLKVEVDWEWRKYRRMAEGKVFFALVISGFETISLSALPQGLH